jgi:hypothetical protein
MQILQYRGRELRGVKSVFERAMMFPLLRGADTVLNLACVG